MDQTTGLRSFTKPNAILLLPPKTPAQFQVKIQNRIKNHNYARTLPENIDTQPHSPSLFFFITGNPGLVSYYQEYLELLAWSDSSPSSSPQPALPKISATDTSTGTSTKVEVDRVGDGDDDDISPKSLPKDIVYASFSLGGFEVENGVGQDKTRSTTKPSAGGGGNGGGTVTSTTTTTITRTENDDASDDNDDEDDGVSDEYVHDFLFPPTSFHATATATSVSKPQTAKAATASTTDFAIQAQDHNHDRDQRHQEQTPRENRSKTAGMENKLYSLKEQIDLCYARLRYLCARISRDYYYGDDDHVARVEGFGGRLHEDNREVQAETTKPIRVILAGHSVGAYIALEMVRIHHEQRQQEQEQEQGLEVLSRRGDHSGEPEKPPFHAFRIVSSLLLTPTIIDIAQSRSGRVAAPVLSNIPFFPALLQFCCGGLTTFFAEASLKWIVHKITGMPVRSLGLETTVRFLRSRAGVKQALVMARDELRDIKGDAWGSEVWGVYASRQLQDEPDDRVLQPSNIEIRSPKVPDWQPPKLFLLFARDDHWVADLTRTQILDNLERLQRKSQHDVQMENFPAGQKPIVMIDDEHGLAHAWCLTQSAIVADITRKWIAESLNTP